MQTRVTKEGHQPHLSLSTLHRIPHPALNNNTHTRHTPYTPVATPFPSSITQPHTDPPAPNVAHHGPRQSRTLRLRCGINIRLPRRRPPLNWPHTQCEARYFQRKPQRPEVVRKLPLGRRDGHGPKRCVFRLQFLL